jgi:hypothetical protein
VWLPLLQAFPFPSTGKVDTAPVLSGQCVYLQFMWELGLPPSPVKFSSHCHFYKLSCSCLPGGAAAPASCHICLQFTWELGLPSSHVEFSSLSHSHKLSRSWLLGACPTSAHTRGSPAHRACLFTVYLQSQEGFPSPNLQHSVHPTLFPACLYCSYCLLLSFSFFPRWRSVCPGAMLLWPRLVCGSTAVPQSSPGLRLPKPSGHQQLVAWGPSWFLRLM